MAAREPLDSEHENWFVETEEELAERAEEQCVQCYNLFPVAEVEDGLCRECRQRGLPGRSILEEVSAIRRKVRNWMLLLCLVLLLYLLVQWLVSR